MLAATGDFGRIKPELGEKVLELRKQMQKKVEEYVESNNDSLTFLELKDLRHCARGMAFASIALTVASQSYNDTVLTFTSFQRYYLETVAIYEYYVLHQRMSILGKTLTEKPRILMELVGAVTCDYEFLRSKRTRFLYLIAEGNGS
ncbi:hypothetical protein GALMADRAFT_148695 [Galerina marginata CBS 339.88]|uniref:Uncharacterized protein n=1 Tax=Galerina marginata (strain CBS 339.88) TaxID=685588 RepID=A0A067S6E8_GALM3|nr:hypothetical protein GALMADRAFT_148695 [Galerina marginata CBS 339.88]